jgi:hypothetical protein
MVQRVAGTAQTTAAEPANTPAPQAARKGVVPNNEQGVPVTADMKLSPGTPIQAQWGSFFYFAEVVSLEANGNIKVHYQGWSNHFDEALPRNKLRIDPADAARL